MRVWVYLLLDRRERWYGFFALHNNKTIWHCIKTQLALVISCSFVCTQRFLRVTKVDRYYEKKKKIKRKSLIHIHLDTAGRFISCCYSRYYYPSNSKDLMAYLPFFSFFFCRHFNFPTRRYSSKSCGEFYKLIKIMHWFYEWRCVLPTKHNIKIFYILSMYTYAFRIYVNACTIFVASS